VAAEVVMPKLGLTMEEATIVNWLKDEGDQVSKGEAILEIETDKSTVEVEAPVSGHMGPQLFSRGSLIPVGTVITYVVAPGEALPDVKSESGKAFKKKELADDIKTETQSPKAQMTRSGIMASPIARRLARELGVDLISVTGTGPKGRIMEEDIREASERAKEIKKRESPGPSSISEGVRPLEGIRKLTAERMLQSFTNAPHFYLSVETDASLLMEMRERIIPQIQSRSGERPTISDFLIKIAAQALEEHPEVNAIWENVGVRRLSDINVGLAVATEKGLIVPIFHNANKKPLHEITAHRKELVEKTRKGTVALPDLEGGSFTITNLGTYAVDQFNAIVNPPQSAIMSVGRIKDRPVGINGELALRPTMIVTLSIDHRILDGAEGARFLDTLVKIIEAPYLIESLW
jgi:pyruvate dehydrogenase E2 component (dihydrolipoamide acetyltransferase)